MTPTPARNGERIAFDSYENHSFILSLLKNNNTTEISKIVTVTSEDEQVLVIRKGLEVERIDPIFLATPSRSAVAGRTVEGEDTSWAKRVIIESVGAGEYSKSAHDVVARCRSAAKAELSVGKNVDSVAATLTHCIEQRTALIYEQLEYDITYQNSLLKSMSSLAENYTCTDSRKETSTPQEWRTWEYEGVTRDVGIFHNRTASQIHILKNFISPEECEAIRKAAEPSLHRGTVADGKGGSRMSENRKAWQAGVQPGRGSKDPILAVKKRLFAYANYVTGYGMELPGQEDIMSIQYFGNGDDDKTPDRYTPHCDGDCDGMPHKHGSRVATMVMYCDAPEKGGATNFQNANVFVNPEVGAAAFFSYMDPESFIHDDGFTSHSGCPVFEGTKRIAVQWMRLGVDESNPWDSFDTNTISKRLLKED